MQLQRNKRIKVHALLSNKELLKQLFAILVCNLNVYEQNGVENFNGFDIKELKGAAELLYNSKVDSITSALDTSHEN